ncbi:MAG TPA: CDP-glycerol glycerophosphotransferase family protein [Candidatus Limnocylindrales bacterium]|nr:CDP-glycerol glycerophosphotransferase family protein [Candidatus Limnocylindrales bacterium]
MTGLEYRLASVSLRLLGRLFDRLPIARRRVVLATARVPRLDGNLAHVDAALRARYPELDYVHLLEPYGYGLFRKVAYMGRLVRGMYHLRRARLFVVDNAYLPIHVAPHRRETTVVQVWHATGALKRFGADTTRGLDEPERTFLHRNYDYVVVSGEAAREPYSRALRTPVERVLALGTPRTDSLHDRAWLESTRTAFLDAHPALAGRRIVLYAPTFRGRGRGRWAAEGLDAVRLRSLLPPAYALVLKTHPNLDPALSPRAGFDVVLDHTSEIEQAFAATDVFVTDYSSSILDWAILRRPLVVLVPDLEEYERDPGLYLDYRTEMIGAQVRDTDEVAAAVLAGVVDERAYDAFVERNLGRSRGGASERFVERFARPLFGPPRSGPPQRGPGRGRDEC